MLILTTFNPGAITSVTPSRLEKWSMVPIKNRIETPNTQLTKENSMAFSEAVELYKRDPPDEPMLSKTCKFINGQ